MVYSNTNKQVYFIMNNYGVKVVRNLDSVSLIFIMDKIYIGFFIVIIIETKYYKNIRM